jgi:predicted transport protein
MALFNVKNEKARKLNVQKFKNEKELQTLFENSLEEIFGVRFLDSEFTTSHGGRIDTLGLDDNNAPVIIEYKEGEKDNVINQGLFYLDWLMDHKGDFEKLVRQALGEIEINWSDSRLIIVAKSYNEYDKYAVNRISDNIELWRYILYQENSLLVERIVLPKGEIHQAKSNENKKEIKQIKESYTLEHHIGDKETNIKELVEEIREKMLKMDDQIIEKFNKKYIGYSLEKNFMEIVVQSNGLWIHLDIDKDKIKDPEKKLVDISEKGHWATGDLKIRIEKKEDIPYLLDLVVQSYEANK